MSNLVINRPLDLMQEVDRLRVEQKVVDFFERTGIHLIAGGAAGEWTFTDAALTSLLDGTFDLDTDTFLVALFLSTSDLGTGSTTYAAVTNEHANNNGYTTGGVNIGALTLSGTSTVTIDDPADVVWTASGGSIIARFAAIYESAGNVLCFCLLDDAPADVTATDGNTLTIQFNVSGIATLTQV